MLSILNILRKCQPAKGRGSAPQGHGTCRDPLEFPASEQQKAAPAQGGDSPLESCLNLCDVVNKDAQQQRYARTKQWYQEAVGLAKAWYCPGFVLGERLKDLAQQAATILQKNYQEIIGLATGTYEKQDDWLYAHAVNVMIFALELGRALRFDSEKLAMLGMAGLLHDIGETNCLELINKSEALGLEEYKRIKEHPRQAEAMLRDKGLVEAVVQAVAQEHERLDGSGYPAGLRSKAVGEFAQIIGVCDAYEAMTHTRPYRKRRFASEAIEELLRAKKAFSPVALKMLLERIGIYPVGSAVRLNTKESGVVSRMNFDRPLRPVVTVMFDKNGQAAAHCKELDLAANPLVSIEACLDALPLPTGANL